MFTDQSTNFIRTYENAVKTLNFDSRNQSAQYQAVLALARMGSVDLAAKDYKRYGLDKVRHNEDIMALGGRLSKDRFLTSSGRDAVNHALDSSEKYEAAYKDTKGFYSGINAATMGFLANMPIKIIFDRVTDLLEKLPSKEKLISEEHYFVEATRAECFLLLNERDRAREALRSAISHDPLNYVAHASTLKQLRMILKKRDESGAWLEEFQPARPAHYAGHIWTYGETPNGMNTEISDIVQRHDIGFMYGALAAGADIEIAEAALGEGVELNVLLPCNVEKFIESSVRPYGQRWVRRFEKCLSQSVSLTCLPQPSDRNIDIHYLLGSRVAMGHSILRGKHLAVKPYQLLIRNPMRRKSLTSLLAKDWVASAHESIEVRYKGASNLPSKMRYRHSSVPALIKVDETKEILEFPDLTDALIYLQEHDSPNCAITFTSLNSQDDLNALTELSQIASIKISESVAGYMALMNGPKYDITFAGSVTSNENENLIRCYTLNHRPERN